MEAVMERECSALGGLFHTVIADMKGSFQIWDDFINKAAKLQSHIRATVAAVASFLDAFQKVADMASSSRGATRDLGFALSRVCVRQRGIETRLRRFSMLMLESLINPLQEQMDEWRRSTTALDKDHAKEYKKARQEMKKRSSDSLRLQKKAKKGRGEQPSDSPLKPPLFPLWEEAQSSAVRRALVEERGRFCCFVSMLRPLMEEEVGFLSEVSHLQSLSEDLRTLSMDPHKLPASSEQVLLELKTSDSCSLQTPPSSPGSTVSRKSSMSRSDGLVRLGVLKGGSSISSVNSVSSGDSRSSGSPHFRFRSGSGSGSGPVQSGSLRLSSVSSHDSGFNSHNSRSPSVSGLSAMKRSHTTVPISHQGDDITVGAELVQALDRGLKLDLHTPGSDRESFSLSSEPDALSPDPSLSFWRLHQTRCVSQTPGVATIRRAPSSKLRRANLSLSLNPGLLRPPVIPVQTPTVPRAAATPPSPPPQPLARAVRAPRSPREERDYLCAIRRGVKLKRNKDVSDRSAPRIQ